MPSIPEYPVTSTSNFRNTAIYWLQQIFTALAAALPAGANVIGSLQPVHGAGTWIYGSVSTATQVLPAANRQTLKIQCTATTGVIYATFDNSTPSAANGFAIVAQANPFSFGVEFTPTGPVKLFAAAPLQYAILQA
jgi:hypothetical protein